jgi:hypothetical protein
MLNLITQKAKKLSGGFEETQIDDWIKKIFTSGGKWKYDKNSAKRLVRTIYELKVMTVDPKVPYYSYDHMEYPEWLALKSLDFYKFQT